MDFISIAYSCKDSGNAFWKQKNYENAKTQYSKALLAITHIFKEDNTQTSTLKLVREIQIPCLLNLAACHLNLKQNYDTVVLHCTDVLKIEPGNVKALYRRAVAFIELGKFDMADCDIRKARELDPENEMLSQMQMNLRKIKKSFKGKSEVLRFSLWTLFGKIIIGACKRRFVR